MSPREILCSERITKVKREILILSAIILDRLISKFDRGGTLCLTQSQIIKKRLDDEEKCIIFHGA